MKQFNNKTSEVSNPSDIESKRPHFAKASGGKQEYDPSSIEKKWQEVWDREKVYSPDLDTAQKPFYNLMMFPYPSAEGLHVGSVFTFTGVDTYGRFKRMQGYDVFEPMGLDGFGIHSENYALKVGRHPIEQAKRSEENFYRQLSSIGNSFDWSRKLETYDPRYYKWTQWIFIQLFKQGLAYRKKAPVNFCPSCKTVLSDEQVIDGKCERCSTVVEKRELEQWFFKITNYAERLLHNIPSLNWTNKVKIAQEQWIGKKEGIQIAHAVVGMDLVFETFSAYPAWSWADSFIVIAPEHPLVQELVKGTVYEKDVLAFVKEMKNTAVIERTAEKGEKKGVFTGRYAKDPFGGPDMPIWLANFALLDFGTGIIRCSGHDPRDVEFAAKYGITTREVVEREDPNVPINAHTNKGILKDSGPFTGREVGEVIEEVREWIETQGIGKKVVTYHLRDWLISRQRYWGPPIPMIFCEKPASPDGGQGGCGWQPVPEEQLPVLLPDVADWKPKGDGTSPLANMKDFVETTCPNCGGKARRETDVSDTFLDSAWYFFRYLATEWNDIPFPMKKNEILKQVQDDKGERLKWLPVTMYIGGAEHSVLHLLYSRFITMVFKDMGLIDFEEPYARFYAHGLIIKDGAKMSKSKGNVINPDEYLAKYGVDVLRAYLRFVGPFDMGGDFRDSGIEGMERFINRVWKLLQPEKVTGATTEADKRMMHKTIKGVTDDLEALHFNTVVAKLMTWYNYLSAKESVSAEEAKVFVQLLAPITPFLSEELWYRLTSSETSVHTSAWPTYAVEYLQDDEVTIVVQVNGKVRDSLIVSKEDAKNQQKVEESARASEKVIPYLSQGAVRKVIFVPGKIINFVI